MNKTITLLAAILYYSICSAQAPAIQWQKTLGGTSADSAFSICQTSDGGYAVAGDSYSTDGDVTENHGNNDCWVVKLTDTGTAQWQKSFGGTGWDHAECIQQTTDGGYIVGGFSYSNDGDITGNHGNDDYWIVKLTAAGAIQWQKTLGGTGNDELKSIQQTSDDGFIIAGWSSSTDGDITSNHGGSDYWIVKLDKTGNIQWQKSLGGTKGENAQNIQQCRDGGYIVAGTTNSNDGDVTGTHGIDIWIVKLDNAGTIQWQKALGGTGNDYASWIQQTSDSGYIVAGWIFSTNGDITGNHGGEDFWVIKLSETGTIQWQKTLGGSNDDGPSCIQQTRDGGYIVAGFTESIDGDVTTKHGDDDAWIVKLDKTGTMQWQKTMGGTAVDDIRSIKQTTDDGYIMAGFSLSNDGDVSGNHGDGDFWVVKLAADNLGTEDYTFGNNLRLYPNPACETFKISNLNTEENLKGIVIYDVMGKMVKTVPDLMSNQATLDVSHLPTGVYMVEATSGSDVKSIKKLVVQ